MKEVTFLVDGMHCAACSSSVERVVRRLKGVEEISVNLTTTRARVKYDPALVKLAEIQNAVVKAGFTPRQAEEGADGRVKEEARRKSDLLTARNRLITAVCFTLPLMYVCMGHMVWLPLPRALSKEVHPLLHALLQMVLAAPVLMAGRNFFISGTKGLLHRAPNMDTLVAMGSCASFLFSLYMTIRIAAGTAENFTLYYESSAMVITMVMVGKYLEAVSKGKTSDAIKKLAHLMPGIATIEKNGLHFDIPIDELAVGDIMVVSPGARFAADGVVEEGLSGVDQSMLTGESLPVNKQPGDTVVGGSLNGEGVLKVRTTHVAEDTQLSGIIRMVEQAQEKKAPIARLADVVSGYFVPAVLGIALIAAICWALAGKNAEFVLNIFVSVLVVACPCSLGLATPCAIMVGTGRGAQMGILFKSGESLQACHNIRLAALDKTGTVTEGKPRMTDIFIPVGEENTLLSLCAAAEQGSEHPVAKAIVAAARDRALTLPAAENSKALPGLGMEATVEGKTVLIGSRKLMESRIIDCHQAAEAADRYAAQGKMLMYAAVDGRFAALMAAADTVRSSSKAGISRLRDMGIETVMLTGDNRQAADAICHEAGIDSCRAQILPGEKSSAVEELKKKGCVAMVGDGINDAPALAAADVGIAMGGGTDIAIESAGVILMREDIGCAADAIALSKAVIRNIKENLFWAFLYNTAGIPFAAGVYYIFGGPLLNPVICASAMALSSVCVVTNALRLRRWQAK